MIRRRSPNYAAIAESRTPVRRPARDLDAVLGDISTGPVLYTVVNPAEARRSPYHLAQPRSDPLCRDEPRRPEDYRALTADTAALCIVCTGNALPAAAGGGVVVGVVCWWFRLHCIKRAGGAPREPESTVAADSPRDIRRITPRSGELSIRARGGWYRRRAKTCEVRADPRVRTRSRMHKSR